MSVQRHDGLLVDIVNESIEQDYNITCNEISYKTCDMNSNTSDEDPNTTCDEDSNITCDEDPNWCTCDGRHSNTTCDEDSEADNIMT